MAPRVGSAETELSLVSGEEEECSLYMNDIVQLYDTTGRDGQQDAEFKLTPEQKLELARRLDTLRFHYFEGGWPGANAENDEFFRLAEKNAFKHLKIAAFGSTRAKRTSAEKDPQVQALVRASTPVVTIYGKSSLWQVRTVLRCSPEENLAMIGETVRFLKHCGRIVFFDAEHGIDGFKECRDYARACWLAAKDAGADCIILCDTNGGALPWEVADITRDAVRLLGGCKVGIHPHNDGNVGPANALAAVHAGATHVQGTINGYGERGTNCCLLSAAAGIQFKMGRRCLPKASFRRFCELSEFVDELGDMAGDARRPYVGRLVFSHNGGRHVHAVGLNRQSYEHVDPAWFGNKRTIIVSGQSGKASISLKAKEFGMRIPKESLGDVLNAVKEQEKAGYNFRLAEASLFLVFREAVAKRRLPFTVQEHKVVLSGKGTNVREETSDECVATVKVWCRGKESLQVAEGDGPVNAIDGALRKALTDRFPRLKGVQLIDYRVRIIKDRSGTAATTRVLMWFRSGREKWVTIGVDSDIVRASLKALVDGFEFALLRR